MGFNTFKTSYGGREEPKWMKRRSENVPSNEEKEDNSIHYTYTPQTLSEKEAVEEVEHGFEKNVYRGGKKINYELNEKIWTLLELGAKNNQIAEALGINRKTVWRHKNKYGRLG